MMIAEYVGWREGLAAEGRLAGGMKLKDEGGALAVAGERGGAGRRRSLQRSEGDHRGVLHHNRAISVDTRGILEALDDVYDADRIVMELTAGWLFETEDQADRVRR